MCVSECDRYVTPLRTKGLFIGPLAQSCVNKTGENELWEQSGTIRFVLYADWHLHLVPHTSPRALVPMPLKSVIKPYLQNGKKNPLTTGMLIFRLFESHFVDIDFFADLELHEKKICVPFRS